MSASYSSSSGYESLFLEVSSDTNYSNTNNTEINMNSSFAERMILETSFCLNSCSSKLLQIGLNARTHFTPNIRIYCNTTGDVVVLENFDWKCLMSKSEQIKNYFNNQGDKLKTVKFGRGLTLNGIENEFNMKVVQIFDSFNNTSVQLNDSVFDVVKSLQELVDFRIKMLKSLNLPDFYRTIMKTVSHMHGELIPNIKRIVASFPDHSLALALLELSHFYSEKIYNDYGQLLLS